MLFNRKCKLSEKDIDIINAKFKDIHNNFNVNNGGCCFVASLVATELEKRNIAFELAFVKSSEKSIFTRSNKKIIHDNINKGIAINSNLSHNPLNHVFIRIKNGLINPDRYTTGIYLKNINSKKILDIYNNECWNERYNTKFNKKVKNEIVEIFNEVIPI